MALAIRSWRGPPLQCRCSVGEKVAAIDPDQTSYMLTGSMGDDMSLNPKSMAILAAAFVAGVVATSMWDRVTTYEECFLSKSRGQDRRALSIVHDLCRKRFPKE